ncbi:MAG: transglutaminase-like domain-containing protein [Cyanobacteria bacterium P01_D01_bin.105]
MIRAAAGHSSKSQSSKSQLSKSQSSKSRAPVWFDHATLCSFALLLWGWQTQLLFLAVPMALALEARRIIQQRWEMSANDLREIAKLSGALLVMLFVVIIITQRAYFIYTLFQWLPVAAFPLVMSQTYGLGISARLYEVFSNPYLPRRNLGRQPILFNLHYAFMGLCLLAASATDTDSFAFYGAATVMVGLIVWPLRPQRSSVILWMLLFSLSVGLGFAGHQQLTQAQQQLQAQMLAMLGNYASGAVNPDGTATRMGTIGRLKLSKAIVARIRSDHDNTFPLLLQEASYNDYKLATWKATDSIFQPVPPAEADGEWILAQASEQDSTLEISTRLERSEGLLTLPRGTTRIQNLPVEEMQRNQYSAVQVDAEGSATYQIQFATAPIINRTESPPAAFDLDIPNLEQDAIDQTLAGIFPADNLDALSQTEILNRIAAYFQSFTYSLDLIGPSDSNAPVSDFLLNTRTGHCEYFASATALLLRGAGIPARYAVGFSAHEFSSLEGQYLVRSRDAHAWTLAYLDGKWQIVDNTPVDWAAQERSQDSGVSIFFQSMSDFFSFLGFQVSFRIRQLGELGLKEVLIIMTPVFGYLVWRTAQQFQGKRQHLYDQQAGSHTLIRYGLDSELYDLEKQFSERYFPRQSNESIAAWLMRLQPRLASSFSGTGRGTPQLAAVQDMLTLHYRYRFDPKGLDTQQRQQLAIACQQWIQYLKQHEIQHKR